MTDMRIEDALAEIEWLRAHIDTLVRERDVERKWFNDAISGHLAEIERLTCFANHLSIDRDRFLADNARLTAALQRIDGINDNPACYNPMIEEMLRAALEPMP